MIDHTTASMTTLLDDIDWVTRSKTVFRRSNCSPSSLVVGRNSWRKSMPRGSHSTDNSKRSKSAARSSRSTGRVNSRLVENSSVVGFLTRSTPQRPPRNYAIFSSTCRSKRSTSTSGCFRTVGSRFPRRAIPQHRSVGQPKSFVRRLVGFVGMGRRSILPR